jgi:hypothetical protein
MISTAFKKFGLPGFVTLLPKTLGSAGAPRPPVTPLLPKERRFRTAAALAKRRSLSRRYSPLARKLLNVGNLHDTTFCLRIIRILDHGDV